MSELDLDALERDYDNRNVETSDPRVVALIAELRASRKVVEAMQLVVKAALRQVADMETAHDLGETFPLNVALSTNTLEAALSALASLETYELRNDEIHNY